MGIRVREPLRLWPGVVIVVLQWLVRFGLPVVAPQAILYALLGELAGLMAILVWWVIFSRAPWSERLGPVVLMIVALFATSRVLHESIEKGARGNLFPVLAIQVLCLALVVWAVATHGLSDAVRRATMAAAILLSRGVFALVRTGGIAGNLTSDLHWRWSQTPEERLLAQSSREPAVLPSARAEIPPAREGGDTPGKGMDKGFGIKSGRERTNIPPAPERLGAGTDWPGFRGPHRDGIVSGVQIKTDWTATPPVALWRRSVGPDWSSFAVRGDHLYTQEQRGPEEIVGATN